MVVFLLFLELLAFTLAWWLGLYLLGRDPANPQLRFTGLGLVAYALSLAADLLSQYAGDMGAGPALARFGAPLLFSPAFFWLGSLIYLLPEEAPGRLFLGRLYDKVLLPGTLLFYLLAAGTEFVFQGTPAGVRPGPGYRLFAAAVLFDLLGALLLLARAFRAGQPRRPLGLILAATLFFALGTGLLLFPLAWIPHWLLVLGVGVDLTLLGLAIAFLDAFQAGEALLPDFFRSLAVSALAVLLFGGQVALVMWFSAGLTFSMLVLLLAVIATAVATQTFADAIQAALDWLVFARFPRLRLARASLRA
ncbi:MAG: hypothetical protein L0322_00435, partial [Chloroflexi bacterium]|nr:hypothetical protein [Chloroflexota bacterium]